MYGAGVRHPLRLCSPHRHSSIGGGDDKNRKLFLTILSWKWHSSFARILFNRIKNQAPSCPCTHWRRLSRYGWSDGRLIKHSIYIAQAASEIPQYSSVCTRHTQKSIKIGFYLMKTTDRQAGSASQDRRCLLPYWLTGQPASHWTDMHCEKRTKSGYPDIFIHVGTWNCICPPPIGFGGWLGGFLGVQRRWTIKNGKYKSSHTHQGYFQFSQASPIWWCSRVMYLQADGMDDAVL